MGVWSATCCSSTSYLQMWWRKIRPSVRHMMKTFSPVTWESGVLVQVQIGTFAWRLQHQAGMAAAAIPATMGDDGYKFLMQKSARPVQRYMNPVDFSDISLNPVKVRFAFLH